MKSELSMTRTATAALLAMALATPLAALGAERCVLGEYFTGLW